MMKLIVVCESVFVYEMLVWLFLFVFETIIMKMAKSKYVCTYFDTIPVIEVCLMKYTL